MTSQSKRAAAKEKRVQIQCTLNRVMCESLEEVAGEMKEDSTIGTLWERFISKVKLDEIEDDMMIQELFIFKRGFLDSMKRAQEKVENEHKLQPFVNGGV